MLADAAFHFWRTCCISLQIEKSLLQTPGLLTISESIGSTVIRSALVYIYFFLLQADCPVWFRRGIGHQTGGDAPGERGGWCCGECCGSDR